MRSTHWKAEGTPVSSRVLFTVSTVFVMTMTSISSVAADSSSVENSKQDPADSGMTLEGGNEGTVFKDLVVRGEDRIRIDFERPKLVIDIDPQTAPGLEWGSMEEVLNRNRPDLVTPFLRTSSYEQTPYLARPWLDQFETGSVARFRPEVEGVDRWQLLIANSRGETVASFDGNGKPPREICWDGRSLEGAAVPPGLTYSYVLEAFDRAGNKRSFVGKGFELPSYRLETSEGSVILFSGSELSLTPAQHAESKALPSALLLEVASRINQSSQIDKPVRVSVTARSFDRARSLADGIVNSIEPLIFGGQARIQPVTTVEPDAPGEGTVEIHVPR